MTNFHVHHCLTLDFVYRRANCEANVCQNVRVQDNM